MKKNIISFLSSLEGYHQRLKEIHWSTTNKAEHLLSDDMDSDILVFEDRIAENTMGALNIRYGIGDLQTLVPSSKGIDDLIKELLKDIDELYKNAQDKPKFRGLINILDDFYETVNKWNYLRTLK